MEAPLTIGTAYDGWCAVAAARLLRRGRRRPALHPGRRAEPRLAALAVPADPLPGTGVGRRTVPPLALRDDPDRRGRGAAAAGPPDPGRHGQRPAGRRRDGAAAPRPGPLRRAALAVRQPRPAGAGQL